jgi:cell division protein FtsQ
MRPLIAPRRVAPAAARAAAAPSRRDPAPSRLAYRIDRLWLTPFFRALCRVGLPAFAVILFAGIYIGDEGRRAAIETRIAEIRRQIEERPEFMVRLIAIDGASPAVAEAVRGMVPVPLPASSFHLDLEAVRERIAGIDAVERADLRIRAGGILQVDITERVPVVLWRIGGRTEMLDATGHRVATLLSRAARPDLPLIAGEGADAHVPEALDILASAQPIRDRIRGLVRMGERRWDLVLDRDQRIMLPEDEPAAAMARAVALDQSQDLLTRDLVAVDLRNPERLTLRMSKPAAEVFHDQREQALKVSGQ